MMIKSIKPIIPQGYLFVLKEQQAIALTQKRSARGICQRSRERVLVSSQARPIGFYKDDLRI
jgi:hypothetical protein